MSLGSYRMKSHVGLKLGLWQRDAVNVRELIVERKSLPPLACRKIGLSRSLLHNIVRKEMHLIIEACLSLFEPQG